MTDQARRLVAALVALGSISAPIRAQTDGTCIPVAERAGRDFGCFITARESLGKLSADSLAAVYMEGVFQPGMQNVVHRHHGAEAWYTLEGAMCLETPEGKIQQTAGDTGVLVRAGLPMVLTGTGSGPRRSVVLILQDATKPRSTPAMDWTPLNLCQPSSPGR